MLNSESFDMTTKNQANDEQTNIKINETEQQDIFNFLFLNFFFLSFSFSALKLHPKSRNKSGNRETKMVDQIFPYVSDIFLKLFPNVF